METIFLISGTVYFIINLLYVGHAFVRDIITIRHNNSYFEHWKQETEKQKK